MIFLVYLEIKRGNFKIDSVWTVFTLFYKSMYITAMFVSIGKYPGYQIIILTAIFTTILYVILTYFVKRNNNLAIRGIIYYFVFSLFPTSLLIFSNDTFVFFSTVMRGCNMLL